MAKNEQDFGFPKVNRKDLLPKVEKKEPPAITYLRAFLFGAVEQGYLERRQAKAVFRKTRDPNHDYFDNDGDMPKGALLTGVARLAHREAMRLYQVDIQYHSHQSIVGRMPEYEVKNAMERGERVIVADAEAYYLVGIVMDDIKVKPVVINPNRPNRHEMLKYGEFREILKNGWLSIPQAPEATPGVEVFSAESQGESGSV